MHIACPSCAAAYEVPDSLMTPGRVVRCARCSGQWVPVEATPVPEETAPEGPERESSPPPREERGAVLASRPPAEAASLALAPPPRFSAMDRLAAYPAWPKPRLWLRLAWAGSLVLLVLGVGGAYGWRSQIVDLWPPSARMYAVFGMHPGTNSTR
jgi:predicted Zn finger-like uncharacterized protein